MFVNCLAGKAQNFYEISQLYLVKIVVMQSGRGPSNSLQIIIWGGCVPVKFTLRTRTKTSDV